MKLLLSAHRCGTDKYPELTIEAARYSLELGADSVEMDIRFTKDQIPVISHDKDGVKLFGTDKNVCDLDLAEFLKLRFVDRPEFHPHTLQEVLDSKAAPILFHIKEGGEHLRTILEEIRAYRYEEKVIIGVQTVEDVRLAKEFSSRLEVLAFSQENGHDEAFIDAGADIIRLWEDWVTAERVHAIQSHDRKVWVMAGCPVKRTVGYTDQEKIRSWKHMGIDGLIINEIAKTRSILNAI